MKLFTGIDGCRAGWFAVCLYEDFSVKEMAGGLLDTEGIEELCKDSELALIDIPIGLKSSIDSSHTVAGRVCDSLLRRELGKKAPSVFAVPLREAVYAKDYGEARAINRRFTGKSLSVQSWNLCDKIRKIDSLMRKSSCCRKVLRESHPELCFCKLKGKQIKYGKKTAEGREERLEVLGRFLPREVFLSLKEFYLSASGRYRRDEVRPDDVLDAVVLAVTASLSNTYTLKGLPPIPEHDRKDLPMQVLYWEPAVERRAP